MKIRQEDEATVVLPIEAKAMHYVFRLPIFTNLFIAVTFWMGLENQLPPKYTYSKVFKNMYRLTKQCMLGSLQASILLRNVQSIFLVLYRDTQGWLVMSLKWYQICLCHTYQAVFMHFHVIKRSFLETTFSSPTKYWDFKRHSEMAGKLVKINR